MRIRIHGAREMEKRLKHTNEQWAELRKKETSRRKLQRHGEWDKLRKQLSHL